MNLSVGDSVAVKPHVSDPDLGGPIGGWQGRISEVDLAHGMVDIDWDSLTIEGIPDAVIIDCEEKGLSWTQMRLGLDDVEPAAPRDTPADVESVRRVIAMRHAWAWLVPEGAAIGAVLAGVDPEDEWAAFEAWDAHLREALTFPFEAEVDEFQERGPIRDGDRVTVRRIVGLDDLYGILVEIERRGDTFDFPLCDLDAAPQSSHRDIVHCYGMWFSNR